MPEERNENAKLTWDAPKLYALDKGKTEGGPSYMPQNEGTSYYS
ncbi:MAG: hypothetical protein ACLFVR_15345 [Thiohalospira sp.]